MPCEQKLGPLLPCQLVQWRTQPFLTISLFLSFKRTSLPLLMSWPLNCWQLCYLIAHRTKASGVKLRTFYQCLRKTATSLLWGNTSSESCLLWLVIEKYWQLGFPPKDVTAVFLLSGTCSWVLMLPLCCHVWSCVWYVLHEATGEFWMRDFIVLDFSP